LAILCGSRHVRALVQSCKSGRDPSKFHTGIGITSAALYQCRAAWAAIQPGWNKIMNHAAPSGVPLLPQNDLPAGTRFVDAFAIDLNGIARGKRLTASSWPGAARQGVAFSASALVLDARGVSQGPCGIGTADGDPDATGLPVAGTVRPVPWAGSGVAQCLLSLRGADGGSLWYDPREILRAVAERCRADGLHPVISCELEFTLIGADEAGRPQPLAGRRGGVAGTGPGHLCLQHLQDQGPFLHALHDALAAQGIPGDGLVSEYGAGQFELNLLHGPDPVLAADHAALQRRATVGVAAAHGARASFMAKPFAGLPGNGLHVHVSLVDAQGENRFGAAGGQILLEQAVAGMQRLHAESMALFAPSFSAYRRYRPGSFVSLSSAWGEDNRSVAFRVPRSRPGARRIEHRVAAADASPHLVVAAILAAIHHGVTGRLSATPAAQGNVDSQADPALPGDIFAALRAFEQSTILAGYLPTGFPALFATVKRREANDLLAEVQPAEHDFYL
jgi:glutamine synthetase